MCIRDRLQGGRGLVELAKHPLRFALQRQRLGGGFGGIRGLEGLVAQRDPGLVILAAVIAGLGLGRGGNQGGEHEEEGAHGGLSLSGNPGGASFTCR